jgi:23S rRNA pseudouridine1911/1915/1917 synthase
VLSKEDGREALTYWEVIERFEGYAHLRLQPKTGRTHQLRVHLSSIDLAIVKDPLYRSKGGQPARLPSGAPPMNRHALHAAALCFLHPSTGEEVSFSAPSPEDMQATLAWLRSERPRA